MQGEQPLTISRQSDVPKLTRSTSWTSQHDYETGFDTCWAVLTPQSNEQTNKHWPRNTWKKGSEKVMGKFGFTYSRKTEAATEDRSGWIHILRCICSTGSDKGKSNNLDPYIGSVQKAKCKITLPQLAAQFASSMNGNFETLTVQKAHYNNHNCNDINQCINHTRVLHVSPFVRLQAGWGCHMIRQICVDCCLCSTGSDIQL